MKTDGEPSVFVERELECAGQPMVIRFFQPIQLPTHDYRCDWEIHWPERIRRSRSHGIDSIQALLLSMRTVHNELILSEPYKAGVLTYFGGTDFDLPPHYGDEA